MNPEFYTIYTLLFSRKLVWKVKWTTTKFFGYLEILDEAGTPYYTRIWSLYDNYWLDD